MDGKSRVVKSELKALIVKNEMKFNNLAKEIEMPYDTLLKKLNGYIPFKQEEIELLKNKLKIADKDVFKYFF